MLLKKIIRTIALTLALLPCFVHAQDSLSPAKTACEKTWMTHVDDSSDDVSFRDFGQKYCDCVAGSTKMQDMCMSRTVLYLAMDNIGATEGLSNLTEDKIKASCNNIWEIVKPNIPAANTEKNLKFCACAAPKLNALAKEIENYTDREWYAKINDVAAGC